MYYFNFCQVNVKMKKQFKRIIDNNKMINFKKIFLYTFYFIYIN